MNSTIMLTVFACVVFFSGCSATQVAKSSESAASKLKHISSGKVGCLPEDITLEVISAGWNNTALWKASCRGETYICSYDMAGEAVIFNCAQEK